MDNVSKLVRSRTMAAVRSSGNRSTEWKLRAQLVRAGVRGWRLNARDITGCPDFVFDAERIAIFLDGCFWHGCPSCHRPPSSNQDYWRQKVSRNRKRDRKHSRTLRQENWTVLRIWEHELKAAMEAVMRRIQRRLQPQ